MERRQRKLRIVGLALIIIALLLGVYITVVYLAYQSGQELQVSARNRHERRHCRTGGAGEEIAEGNHRLAMRRLSGCWSASRRTPRQ